MTLRRLEAVRQKLSQSRLHAFLVTHLPHVQYLTGFSGSYGVCLITPESQYFVSDGRYKDQAPKEISNFQIVISNKRLPETMARMKLLKSGLRLGFEGTYLPYAEVRRLEKVFPRTSFIPQNSVVEALVSVKDSSEIRLIEKAVSISDRVFKKILSSVSVGTSELDVAAEIVYWHRRFGAEADAFEPIVASGYRSALPHARASEKRIQKGEMVTLDFGCRYKGYASDLTRTVAVGKPQQEMRRVYNIVKEAQTRAIESARNGMQARSLDRVARTFIKNKKYGKFFNHSLGHGLGREVHETPRISALSKDVLQTGNVITIEPGIYLPGIGGVRIEDDVVVGEQDCRVLTGSPRELIIV